MPYYSDQEARNKIIKLETLVNIQGSQLKELYEICIDLTKQINNLKIENLDNRNSPLPLDE